MGEPAFLKPFNTPFPEFDYLTTATKALKDPKTFKAASIALDFLEDVGLLPKVVGTLHRATKRGVARYDKGVGPPGFAKPPRAQVKFNVRVRNNRLAGTTRRRDSSANVNRASNKTRRSRVSKRKPRRRTVRRKTTTRKKTARKRKTGRRRGRKAPSTKIEARHGWHYGDHQDNAPRMGGGLRGATYHS